MDILHELIVLYARYLFNCSKLDLDLTNYKASFGYCCYLAYKDIKFIKHMLTLNK